MEISGGRAGRQPAALVTSTGVSFSRRPVTSIDVGIDGRAGRQPAALVTNTGVSFTLRTSTRPSTGVSFSRRPVTSIDVGIDGRAGRQPAALVTNTGVSFTLRTSTRPRPSTRPNTIVSFSGWPAVTSIDVGIDGRAGRQPAARPW